MRQVSNQYDLRTAIFSTEMSEREIQMRILSAQSHIHITPCGQDLCMMTIGAVLRDGCQKQLMRLSGFLTRLVSI